MSVELQIFPADYHTLGCPVFFLESTLNGCLERITKWETRSSTGVYLGNSPFHAGPVALILNIRTRHIFPQYHVVSNDTFSTVEHMRKGIIPVNWKNLVD